MLACIIVGLLSPVRVRETMTMSGGEWALVVPSTFWYASMSHSFTTVPADTSASTSVATEGVYIYNRDEHPEPLAYVSFHSKHASTQRQASDRRVVAKQAMDSESLSLLLGSSGQHDWTSSSFMTCGSTVSFTTAHTPTPLNFVALSTKEFVASGST